MQVGDLVKFGPSYSGGMRGRWGGVGIIIGRSEDMSYPPPRKPVVLWRVWFLRAGRILGHIRNEQLEVISASR